MRKFLIALILLLTIVFVIGRSAEVENLILTFQRGDLIFLLLALLIQMGWIVCNGASYQALFKIQGIDEKLGHTVRLSAAANFFNVIAPSGGMGGLLVFFSDARRHGYSTARIAVSGALWVLFDYAGLLMVLPLGFLVLFQNNNLKLPEEIAASLLVLAGGGITFLLYLGMRSAEELGSVLAFLARIANRVMHLFIRRDYFQVERAYSFAHDAAEGIRELRRNPRGLLPPLLLGLTNKVLMIVVLSLVFIAFQVPLDLGTVVAGFTMAYLFLIMSPTPSGIGIVEGILTISLHSLGVPLQDAAVITLAYRGYTFWVPFLFGLFTFRHLVRVQEINGAGIN